MPPPAPSTRSRQRWPELRRPPMDGRDTSALQPFGLSTRWHPNRPRSLVIHYGSAMGGHPVLVAGFVAAALVVGGCSSGAQGAPGPDVGTPPPSTSSAPSLSPSATDPATLDAVARERIPKAARAHTPQGAEAFARFYLEQVNKAWMAPDPELIRPYALESCKTCANLVGSAEWLRDHNSRYDVAPTLLGASVVLPESTRDHMLVRVVQAQQASRILDANGDVQRSFPGVRGESEVALNWQSGSWMVQYVKDVRK
jgi:hypothetical protein